MSGPRTLLARVPYSKLRLSLSSSNVATNAWTEVTSALEKACTAITVYYSGIGILRVSQGAAAAEDNSELPIYLTPGMDGNLLIPIEISKGKRLSIRALDQAVAEGELVINLFG